MNKLILALAVLAAITLAVPMAHAESPCDEDDDDYRQCMRQYQQYMQSKSRPGAAPPRAMPPRAKATPNAAQRTQPATTAAAPDTADAPTKTGGRAESCKKYLPNIGQMVSAPCD